jgi:uncharacterized phiE125 gp8 family phage protein
MKPQSPVLVTPPAALPVTLGTVKEHLRVDHDDEDNVITTMIGAATAYLDGWSGILGRCLVTQTWAQSFDEFPGGDTLRLPFPDVASVTITYRDNDNLAQTFSASNYALATDTRSSRIVLADGASWPGTFPRPDAVTVSMVAGYGAPDDVPPILKHAIRSLAAAMYEGREGQVQGSPAFDAFIAPFRRVEM